MTTFIVSRYMKVKEEEKKAQVGAVIIGTLDFVLFQKVSAIVL